MVAASINKIVRFLEGKSKCDSGKHSSLWLHKVIQLCNGIEGCNSISLDGANNTADCASQNEPLEIATRLPRL